MSVTAGTVMVMDATAAALLISAVSLLLAGLSLGWQIAQWLLSAGRAKATLMHGLVQREDPYVGPVAKNGSPFDLAKLRRQGIDGPSVVGIQVVNRGRAPLSVERVSLCTRGGTLQFVPIGDVRGPALPYRLAPGTNASWYVSEDNALRLVNSSREALGEPVIGVYMSAQLGTGKTVKTPQTLRA